MIIFRDLKDIPADFGESILSVGNFDGVHRAHQHVLREIVKRAKITGSNAVVVTFFPHPMRILHPERAPRLLTPLPIKLKLLEETGLDAILVLPFTRDLSLLKPRQFAADVLKKKLHAREVHEGFNFHFGHKAEGNVEKLAEFGHDLGFKVKIYPEMSIRRHAVSSSRIRELLQNGDVSRARQLLGRVFSVLSTPGRGRGYGAKYTVPTINLSRYDELVPADGVYITNTRVGTECFDSVTNVGNRPTFGPDSFAIETHLLNFHPLELTADTEVEIFFLRRLRPEIKFPSVEDLKKQIGEDVRTSQKYLGRVHCYSQAKPEEITPSAQ
jgi:riboflavin kinase/FMN adenylyltransferase